jgi:hypothetical protein
MINDLFSKGFFVTRLPVEVADAMLEIVERQDFVSITGESVYTETNTFLDKSLAYPEIWSYKGKPVQAFDESPYPAELVDIWHKIRVGILSPFESIMGSFDHVCMLAHRFSTGQQIGFHSDTTEASFFGLIAYLGDSGFTEEDGGFLRLGRAAVNRSGVIERVYETGRVYPNHGNLVVVSNIDPTFVHAVEPLKRPKKRLTQACRFGYSSQRYSIKNMDRGGYS